MHNFIKKMTLLCLRKSNSDATHHVHPTQTNLYTNRYRKIRRYISFFITPIILSLLIACGSSSSSSTTPPVIPPIIPPTSISSAEELAAIRANSAALSGSYALTGNIVMSSISNWQPIGNFTNAFTGSFDGNGYNISGISSSGYEAAGLFGYVENANIRNVGVLVGNLSSSSSNNTVSGGLIGYAGNSEIINSYAIVLGNISSSSSSSSSAFAGAGGLVGWAFKSRIINSYAIVSEDIYSSSFAIVSEDMSRSYAGGLVGGFDESSISNSYALVVGSISSSSSSDSFSGGLVGFVDDNSPISNSYYSASRESSEGGFTNDVGTFQTPDELSALTAATTTWDGGIWDFGTDSDLPRLRSSNLGDISVPPPPVAPPTVPSGTISISSAAELAAIRANSDTLSGSYALTRNIDLSAISNWQPIGNLTNRFIGSFDGNGYNISGISSSGYEYAGLFGYVESADISNVGVLVDDISSSYSSNIASAGGLIGYASYSRISNSYAVVGGSISSTSTSSSSAAGGLVGASYYSPISNSYALVGGNISSNASSSLSLLSSFAGGLVGEASSSPISNSYALVGDSISSSSSSASAAGGLVGEAIENSPISNSYALVGGSISSTSSSASAAGGLVGEAIENSPISNSYALVGGSISSTSSSASAAGGLVGDTSNSPIIDSYALVGGSISSSSSASAAGGLVGDTSNSPISNSYYSASRESSEGGFDNFNGTSQTPVQLGALTAAGTTWDESIWDFGTDNDLPRLRSSNFGGISVPPPPVNFPATPDPFNAQSAGADAILMYWGDALGAEYYELYTNVNELVTNITNLDNIYIVTDLSPDTGYTYRLRACNENGCSDYVTATAMTDATPQVPPPTEPSDITNISSTEELAAIRTNSDTLSGAYALTGNIDLSAISNWQPIGNFTNAFTGSFDGNGYNISGISSRGYQIAGLFGHVANASISNIGVLVGNISSSSSARTASGGLIGYAFNSSISNSFAMVSEYIYSFSSASSAAGGLVGVVSDSQITDSYAEVVGDISATANTTADALFSSAFAGGLVGDAYMSWIITSSAEIAGSIYSTTNTTANIYGGANVGGLAGGTFGSTVSDSYAVVKGNIFSYASNASNAGGLVGDTSGSPVIDSYALVEGYISSNASDSFYAGGLVGDFVSGFSEHSISNSYYNASRKSSEGGFTNDYGTSQTPDELRALIAATTGWSDIVWDFGTNNDLPRLRPSILAGIFLPPVLAPPSNVVISSPDSGGDAHISWDSVSGALYYEVHDGNELLVTVPHSTTSYIATELLSSGIFYDYGVRACNLYGCSAFAR